MLHYYKTKVYKIRLVIFIMLCAIVTNIILPISVSASELQPIMEETIATKEDMVEYYENNSPSPYPQEYLDKDIDIENFIHIIMHEAHEEGVRADLVFVQILEETDWLTFNDEVDIEQNNFGGLKDQEGNYLSFDSIEEGIRANIQLLKGYDNPELVNQDKTVSTPEASEEVLETPFEILPQTDAVLETPLEVMPQTEELDTLPEIEEPQEIESAVLPETKIEKSSKADLYGITPVEVKTLTISGSGYTGGSHRIRSYGTSANGVLYQFWVKDLSINKWTMIQDYSKSSAPWTPTKPGKYLYGVHIKDEKSRAKLDTHLYKEITIKPAEVKTLTISGSGYTGGSHRIRSYGTSANGVLYQFWVKDLSANKWTMIQDYSKNSAPWTPTRAGKYLYGVHIKDEKSNAKLDSHLYQEITIKDTPVEVKTLTIGGSGYVGGSHRIRSYGTSANGVLYQFWVKDLRANKWTMIQDYSKSSAPWTPTKPGKYLYGVHIKDEKSKAKLDTHLYKEITIKPAEVKTLTIDGPTFVGGNLRIRSYGESANGVVYQFWIKDLSTNRWTMIQDYSKSSALWIPQKAGNYLYGVHIRDEKSTAKLDTHLYNQVTIKSASIIKNYYDETLEEVLKKQMGVSPQTDYYGGGWKNADISDVRYFLDPDNFINDKISGVKINVASNVRNLPNTSGSIVIAQVKKNDVYPILEESNGWYKIIANGTRIGWISGKDVTRTSINNDVQIFQFLDLSKPANISEADLNNFLKGKGKLEGYGKAFKEASIKHNINEVYLVSHALLETGNGSSALAKGILVDSQGRMVDKNNKLINSSGKFIDASGSIIANGQAPVAGQGPSTTVYNILGIGAYDSDPIRLGAQRAHKEGWTSINKAIIGGARFVSVNYIQSQKNNQNTLYKIRWNPEEPATHQYASDIGWAYKQVYRIKELYDLCSNYVLHYDFPNYK